MDRIEPDDTFLPSRGNFANRRLETPQRPEQVTVKSYRWPNQPRQYLQLVPNWEGIVSFLLISFPVPTSGLVSILFLLFPLVKKQILLSAPVIPFTIPFAPGFQTVFILALWAIAFLMRICWEERYHKWSHQHALKFLIQFVVALSASFFLANNMLGSYSAENKIFGTINFFETIWIWPSVLLFLVLFAPLSEVKSMEEI